MLIKLLTCTIAGAILTRLELTGDDLNLVDGEANARLMRAVKFQKSST